MVKADELTPDAITHALRHGEFYSSNGVFLKRYEANKKNYRIEVDTQATDAELAGNPLLRGKTVEQGTEGYRIEFIGPEGQVLATIQGTGAIVAIDPDVAYVRAKVTYTRKKPDSEQLEEYYAWGQPVFTDGRAEHAHEH